MSAVRAELLHELLHVHDPMCSWCWAFRPAWTALVAQLPADVTVRRVVGGLAPDSDVPMPPEMQMHLQGIWRSIEQRVPGTRFNYAFWQTCTPRRSTYNACRAVLAAARLAPELEDAMILAIQRAYYLQARNPSDISTLVDLAVELGLDRARFAAELSGDAVAGLLHDDLALARSAPINGFPGLALQTAAGLQPVQIDYIDAAPMLAQIQALIGVSQA